MARHSIRVAVIGAGMAGRAHAAGYRSAGTVFGIDGPEARLVAVADANPRLADEAMRRYGFERAESSWEPIVAADDIDAVSVVVANDLHREIAEALLAAGKHVLCEKPLAPSVADAEAMAASAEAWGRVAAVGFNYRRSPAIAAIRDQITSGRLGETVHFNGHAWYDYGLDPMAPMSWRYRGGPGSGVLADVGTHLVDIAEFLCGPIVAVGGAMFTTLTKERPVPATPPVGHARVPLTSRFESVDNEDLATFTARFANGALGTFSTSRVAHAWPDGLAFEVFCTSGSAAFDLQRVSEFVLSDAVASPGFNGPRRVLTGPQHPYGELGVPMDSDGIGHGVADLFVYQARAFLEQIAGIDAGSPLPGALPPCASFRDAVHGLRVLEAVVTSARTEGNVIEV